MPEILKTRAIVLTKLNFGDTSKIVSLFTEDYGKMSAIIKGARSPKSKMGAAADLMNYVELVFYQKQNRDVQLITQIELVNHFPRIHEDLDKLIYASSVIELVSQLTADHEPNHKLFRGAVKILELMNGENENSLLLFVKFFMFLLKEIGYEFQLTNCAKCHSQIINSEMNSFDYSHGMLCPKCTDNSISLFQFSPELYKIVNCISSKNCDIQCSDSDLKSLVRFLKNILCIKFKSLRVSNRLECIEFNTKINLWLLN